MRLQQTLWLERASKELNLFLFIIWKIDRGGHCLAFCVASVCCASKKSQRRRRWSFARYNQDKASKFESFFTRNERLCFAATSCEMARAKFPAKTCPRRGSAVTNFISWISSGNSLVIWCSESGLSEASINRLLLWRNLLPSLGSVVIAQSSRETVERGRRRRNISLGSWMV